MTIYYIDPINGSGRNGGSSTAIIQQGSNGVGNNGDVFTVPGSNFTNALVGQAITVFYDPIGDPTYSENYKIVAVLSATQLQLSYYSSPAYLYSFYTAQAYRIGGPWSLFPKDLEGLFFDTGSLTPADTCRVKKTSDPVLVGNAQWTSDSRIVTLPSSVAQLVEACESAFSVANSATSTTAQDLGYGRTALPVTTFTFPNTRTINTKYFFKALAGVTDLSAWSRLCLFMIKNTGTTFGDMRLCLCSDTLGNTIIAEAPIVYPDGSSGWQPKVLDFGGPLPTNVQSIAIYSGTVLPSAFAKFYLNHIIAVKAAGDQLEFTYTSLVGKAHNLNWLPTTTYAANAIRKPTSVNRNGMRFKVTTAGTTGASEPAWPAEVGLTITDGAVVWTCEGPEDTWYTSYAVDAGVNLRLMKGHSTNSVQYSAAGTLTGLDQFYTETEVVPTYIRQSFVQGPANPNFEIIRGFEGEVSGGWSDDFTVMSGETWFAGSGAMNSSVGAINTGGATYKNFGFSGFSRAITIQNNSKGAIGRIENCHVSACNIGVYTESFYGAPKAKGVVIARCYIGNLNDAGRPARTPELTRYSSHSNFRLAGSFGAGVHSQVWIRKNGLNSNGTLANGFLSGAKVSGVSISPDNLGPVIFHKLVTSGNLTIDSTTGEPNIGGGINVTEFTNTGSPRVRHSFPIVLYESSLGEGIPKDLQVLGRGLMSFIRPNGTSDIFYVGHKVRVDRISDSNRRTLSGFAWRIDKTYDSPGNDYEYQPSNPFVVPFDVGVSAGNITNVGVWVKRTANLQVSFGTERNFDFGVNAELLSPLASGPLNTYEKVSVTFTPTKTGVLTFNLRVHVLDSADSGFVYFDDLEIT